MRTTEFKIRLFPSRSVLPEAPASRIRPGPFHSGRSPLPETRDRKFRKPGTLVPVWKRESTSSFGPDHERPRASADLGLLSIDESYYSGGTDEFGKHGLIRVRFASMVSDVRIRMTARVFGRFPQDWKPPTKWKRSLTVGPILPLLKPSIAISDLTNPGDRYPRSLHKASGPRAQTSRCGSRDGDLKIELEEVRTAAEDQESKTRLIRGGVDAGLPLERRGVESRPEIRVIATEHERSPPIRF